jgi:hypothetical protein
MLASLLPLHGLLKIRRAVRSAGRADVPVHARLAGWKPRRLEGEAAPARARRPEAAPTAFGRATSRHTNVAGWGQVRDGAHSWVTDPGHATYFKRGDAAERPHDWTTSSRELRSASCPARRRGGGAAVEASAVHAHLATWRPRRLHDEPLPEEWPSGQPLVRQLSPAGGVGRGSPDASSAETPAVRMEQT